MSKGVSIVDDSLNEASRGKGEVDMNCELCGQSVRDLQTANSYGWTWFTGYLPATKYFCAHCQTRDAQQIKSLQGKAYALPVQPR